MNESIATTGITVLVNGAAQLTQARTLEQWVQAQNQLPGAVATALNGQFVARAQRADKALADGDAIVTFQPIEGG